MSNNKISKIKKYKENIKKNCRKFQACLRGGTATLAFEDGWFSGSCCQAIFFLLTTIESNNSPNFNLAKIRAM